MSVKAERLFEEARRLPQNTRANLAGRLILSLDEKNDKGVEAAWSAELDRRLDTFDASRAQALPWAKVKRNVIRSRRGRK